MSGTVICEVCFGYGWTEEPTRHGGNGPVRRAKGGWVCMRCQGIGSVGTPPPPTARRMTPHAIANRRRRAARRARGLRD